MATEKTFTNYSKEQADKYANARPAYSQELYKVITEHHTTTGGKLDTVLDVGCGPGLATRDIAKHFAHAIGVDAGQSMIEKARQLGGQTNTSEPIRYEVTGAEQLGSNLSPPIPDSSIDLITAANAAHWFDMAGFWPRAAKVLKSDGTVALWTAGRINTHESVPNSAKIQETLEKHRDEYLGPYLEPGSQLAHDGYIDLPMPWTLEHPVSEFEQSSFERKDLGEAFFSSQVEFSLAQYGKVLSTGSAITRWREAHPDLVDTDQDVVTMLLKKIETLLYEAGVEKGQEKLRGTVQGALLLVKKKA